MAQTDAPAAPLPALPPAEASPAPSAAPPPPSAPRPEPTPMVPPAPTYNEGVSIGVYVPHYRHEGFYLSADSGFGFFSAKGSGPLGDASLSGEALVQSIGIGGSIAPGVVLGGVGRVWEATGTFNGGPTITGTRTYFVNGQSKTDPITLSGHAQASSLELAAFVDWFPNPEKGWHVGASIGLGGMAMTDDSGARSVNAGVAGSIFGGYQWWLGPAWSLGIQAVLSGGSAGKLDDSNQNDTGYSMRPLAIGIQTNLLYY
jgi:hypothetical protein